MTTPNPPANGDFNWGTELNNYLTTTVVPAINANETNFSGHVAGAPLTATGSDPHGDRAFAQALMAPFLQNANSGTGFVQLTSGGALPNGSWTDFRPVVSPTFSSSGPGSFYPPQYQSAIDGTVRLAGYFFLTSNSYNGQRVFVNALPASLRPNIPVNLPVTINAAGSSDATPYITIGTDGSVTLNGCPTGLAATTAIGIYGQYPLDSYYGLIQS